MESLPELQDGVRHRLDRRARPAERGDDDEFRLAERREPRLGPDGDRSFRLETRRLRANAKPANHGADKARKRAAGAGDAPGNVGFLQSAREPPHG